MGNCFRCYVIADPLCQGWVRKLVAGNYMAIWNYVKENCRTLSPGHHVPQALARQMGNYRLRRARSLILFALVEHSTMKSIRLQLLVTLAAVVTVVGILATKGLPPTRRFSGWSSVSRILHDLGWGMQPGRRDLRSAINGRRYDVADLLIAKGAEVDIFAASGLGMTERVKSMLLREPELALSRTKWTGESPLHAATKHGHNEIAELLIAHGADVDVKRGIEVSSWGLKHGTWPETDHEKVRGTTPLHIAAREGHLEIVQLLLAHGADVDTIDDFGRNPLNVAATEGYTEVAMYLARNGAGINLESASALGWLDVVERILAKHPKLLNARVNSRGLTPLHVAAEFGHRNVAEYLLNRGADIEARTEGGLTPLHTAAWEGHRDVADCLLSHGANIEALLDEGTPLDCAAAFGHEEVARLLLAKGAKAGIHAASTLGMVNQVQELLAQDPTLVGALEPRRRRRLRTPLHMAAGAGQVPVAKTLVAHGADVNGAIYLGETPLHMAASAGHRAMAQWLLDRGAKVNARAGWESLPPLHAAVKFESVVRLLVTQGARVDIRDDEGKTPLHYAVADGTVAGGRALLEGGADVDAADLLGITPLHSATRAGAKEWVGLLLDHGADPNAEALSGRTPLALARDLGHEAIADLLRRHGATLIDSAAPGEPDGTPDDFRR